LHFEKNWLKIGNILFCTHSEGVESVGNWLAAEFDIQCVLASILDGVVNAEGVIAVVFNVDVQITKKPQR